jgi:hypothetical protein
LNFAAFEMPAEPKMFSVKCRAVCVVLDHLSSPDTETRGTSFPLCCYNDGVRAQSLICYNTKKAGSDRYITSAIQLIIRPITGLKGERGGTLAILQRVVLALIFDFVEKNV